MNLWRRDAGSLLAAPESCWQSQGHSPEIARKGGRQKRVSSGSCGWKVATCGAREVLRDNIPNHLCACYDQGTIMTPSRSKFGVWRDTLSLHDGSSCNLLEVGVGNSAHPTPLKERDFSVVWLFCHMAAKVTLQGSMQQVQLPVTKASRHKWCSRSINELRLS